MLVDTAGARAKPWRYTDADGDRDLRIDFIRGMVMAVLIVVHIELFSCYTFLVWERIGVVSGAEGFVILAGYVTGMVNRRRIQALGWTAASRKLLGRAALLWRVNVVSTCVVAALCFVPPLDMTALTTFTDRAAGLTYHLFPPAGSSIDTWVAAIFLLRSVPHQLQILGLYVCVLAVTPLVLRAFVAGHTVAALLASWAVYTANTFFPHVVTGSQFEAAFPVLTWQLLFVHGLAAGYHREALWRYLSGKRGRYWLVAAGILFAAFFWWAQNTPNPFIPAYARISVVPAAVYRSVYDRFMFKNTLGILRVLDDCCVLAVLYLVLTRCWTPLRNLLGWFFIPLGQASLYVFIVHIYVVLLIANLLPFGFPPGQPNLWVNTAAHTAALGILWLMARYRVFFRWIPR